MRTPEIGVAHGKTPLGPEALGCLLTAEADLSLTMPSRITLSFSDGQGAGEALGIEVGDTLTLSLGYVGALRVVGEGTVARIETDVSPEGRRVTFSAYGPRYILQRGAGAEVFVDTTRGVADLSGARGVRATISAGAASRERALRGGQSAMSWLSEWSGRQAKVITEEGGALTLGPPDLSKVAATLKWEEDLVALSLEINTLRQVSAVEVRGIDPVQRASIVERAKEAQAYGLMGGDESGAAVAEAAFGATTLEIADWPVGSAEEAGLLAKAHFNARLFGFVTGQALCPGVPEVQAGSVVEIQGYARRLDGAYYVTRATHRLGSGGFTSRLEVCRPALNR